MQCVNSLSTVFDCPFDFESLKNFPICNVGCRSYISVEFLSCSDFQVLKLYLQLRVTSVASDSMLQFIMLRNTLMLLDVRCRILPHSLVINHRRSCPSNDICMDFESEASRWRPRLWKIGTDIFWIVAVTTDILEKIASLWAQSLRILLLGVICFVAEENLWKRGTRFQTRCSRRHQRI
jgi:hypothetical protein